MPAPIHAYTTKDAAEILKIKPRTVVDYINAGLIKAVPWVGKSWLIQPKEIERLTRTGIDTNGLRAKLNAKRERKNSPVREKPPLSAERELTDAAVTAVPGGAAAVLAARAAANKAKAEPISAAECGVKPCVRLSVDDTRFKTAAKPRRPAPSNITEKPAAGTYHGKMLTPDEIRFIRWLQLYAKNYYKLLNEKTIDGTSDQWHERCKGILGVEKIKNIIMFLRAKRFLTCDGCNTSYVVRNLHEFFTCAPVEGSALPKGYKYA